MAVSLHIKRPDLPQIMQGVLSRIMVSMVSASRGCCVSLMSMIIIDDNEF